MAFHLIQQVLGFLHAKKFVDVVSQHHREAVIKFIHRRPQHATRGKQLLPVVRRRPHRLLFLMQCHAGRTGPVAGYAAPQHVEVDDEGVGADFIKQYPHRPIVRMFAEA